jgi:hypothetical protein
VAFVQEHSPRRTGLYALAAVVVLAAVAVVVVAVGGGGGGKTKSSSPSREDAKGPTASASLTREDVSFEDFLGGHPLPVASAGPSKSDRNLASGFERSPAGAVLAAIHITTRVQNAVGPSVFEPTITEQVIGADKETLLARVRQSYSENVTTMPTGPNGELVAVFEKGRAERSGVWAYRVDSFSSDSAFVNLLIRTVPGGIPAYVNLGVTVNWERGDWRLVAPLNGDLAGGAQRVTEVPSGYVVIGKD